MIISLLFLTRCNLSEYSLTRGDNDIPTRIFSHTIGKMDDGIVIAGGFVNKGFTTNKDGYFLDVANITQNTSSDIIDALNWISIGIPFQEPTFMPTSEPTSVPTSEPTHPTDQPTNFPTVFEVNATFTTFEPTSEPTAEPTSMPTYPTDQPTDFPVYFDANGTDFPTFIPTSEPTPLPTALPTTYPTDLPTTHPITPSKETLQGRSFPGQLSITYDNRIYSYDETEQAC